MLRIIICFITFLAFVPLNAEVTIQKKDNYIYITGDGMPNHATGDFPSRSNPNAISAQNYNFKVPAYPTKNSSITETGQNTFGVAVNGVPFDPPTAEFWNNDRSSGWAEEGIVDGKKYLGIDSSNAHVQPTGAYHYHGIPEAIITDNIQFVGYAADGFPIYYNANLKSSYKLKSGSRPDNSPGGTYDGKYNKDFEYIEGLGDLGQCNEYTGITPEYPDGATYYVVTETFPFAPRCWIGTPDTTFLKQGGGSNQMDSMSSGRRSGSSDNSRNGPPEQAIAACSGMSSGDSCEFEGRGGNTVSGSCHNSPHGVACRPANMRGRR